MNVDLRNFISEADIKDGVYPGKRVVKPCKQVGEYKNHCVIIDWRDPDVIKLDVRPGLSGKTLAPEVVKNYPVCFQTPTSVTIEVVNDNEDDDEDEEGKGKSSGKGGSGGKKPAQKKKLEDIELISARFSKEVEGKIPEKGKITDMIVMGMKIAKEAFGQAFSELTKQIGHAKIAATEVLAKAANVVTRVTPPEYVKPKGDETVKYKYNRDKNADIGMKMSIG